MTGQEPGWAEASTDSPLVFIPGCQGDVCHPEGDMLSYLLSLGQVSSPDGLLVTWSHGANSRTEMEEGLSSKSFCQEAGQGGRAEACTPHAALVKQALGSGYQLSLWQH